LETAMMQASSFSPGARQPSCNFCGAGHEKFAEFGGRVNAQCTSCGSLERSRAFKVAYQQWGHKLIKKSPRVLLVGPSLCEREHWRKLGEVETLDARPNAGADIVADISACPQIPTGAFDVVAALAVLQHVAEDVAAVAEIHRLLVPGGVFFVQLGFQNALETVPFERVSLHYGPEALAKHNVGTFRKYGLVSGVRLLSQHFTVLSDLASDPSTDYSCFIYAAVKASQDLQL
jgi:SAM-dependent methyltransferase